MISRFHPSHFLIPIAPAWGCILEVVSGSLVILLIMMEYALPPRTDGNEKSNSMFQ